MPHIVRARWMVRTMRVVFFVLLALVTILSLIPNPDDVPGGPAFSQWLARLLFGDAGNADKVSHFIAYGALGFTGILAALRPLGRVWLVPLMLLAYSGLIELAQMAGGVRHGDLADMAANGLGVAAGMAAALGLCAILDRMRGAAA